jgi:hypothetical protein
MRPTLGIGNGPVWLMSTPHRKNGFFYRGNDWGHISVKATHCLHVAAACLEQEQRDLGPDFFAQEYLCHFFAPLHTIFDAPASADPSSSALPHLQVENLRLRVPCRSIG